MWRIDQHHLYKDSRGEEGNYIEIETVVKSEFTYSDMHNVFCFSSQTISDWEVIYRDSSQ